MDNLAHTLIGIGAAGCGLSRRFGAGTTATLVIASNLPDIDAFWTMADPWDRFMLRRTHTHALVMMPVLAALLALAMRWRYREQPWRVLFGLSLLGLGLHVVFDLVNAFGVVILWPFSRHRFELESVFIIDPVLWLLMMAPIVASRFLKTDDRKRRAYRIAVGTLAAYVILCVAARHRAEAQIREDLARRHVVPDAVRMFPEPLGPQRFRAAVKVGDEWQLYLCRLLSGTSELAAVLPTQDRDPRVAEVRAGPRGRDLEWFMAAPVWTRHDDGRVSVHDLRFRTLVIPRTPTFQVEFPSGSLEPAFR